MCLAIPARVVALPEPRHRRWSTSAACARRSRSRSSTTSRVGDYVIVHVGYALTRLDPDEAAAHAARLFAEAGIDGDAAAA